MRIKATLTKPQLELLQSQAKHPAFVAGYGAGKSEVAAWAAIGDAAHSSTALIGLYAPTYDLVRLITAPRIMAKLSEVGVPHKWNKQENTIYTSWPRFGDFILRTMDNPERIVGFETYRSHADELDTLKTEVARTVWNRIISRNRQRPEGIPDPFNKVSAYTTPEGFRFTYDRWVKNAAPGYQIIRAPSYSNPYLPSDYLDNLRASYPDELISAYIEGRFVNLTAGTVYRSYDRQRHRTTETIREGEAMHIGQDFNVGVMASVIFVERKYHPTQPGWHAVKSIKGCADTPALIDLLKNQYPNHAIYVYPDASGKSRKTVDASKSDITILQQAGLKVRARPSNPPVRDRINSVNAALENGALWVNDSEASDFAEGLEMQSYAKNGEPDKTSGFDHHPDAGGYFIQYTMPIRRQTFLTGLR